jgi:glycine cleavage system regulatory protein
LKQIAWSAGVGRRAVAENGERDRIPRIVSRPVKTYFAILAIGEDAPGIVEAITGVLLEKECNIETSQSTIVGGHFATTLIASSETQYTPEAIEESLRQARNGTAVRGVYVNELDPKRFRPFGGPEASHSITAWAPDRRGVLHEIAKALANREVNITALSSGCSEENDSLCVLTLDVSLPFGMPKTGLGEVLADVPEDVRIKIEPIRRTV